MVDRIRCDTVSYLPFYYVFFQFLLLTIFNLQANILTTKDICTLKPGMHLLGSYSLIALGLQSAPHITRYQSTTLVPCHLMELSL